MKPKQDLESVLYAFAMESDPTKKMLNEYISIYPEFAGELIELSFELRFSDVRAENPAGEIVDTKASSAWSQFVSSTPISTSRKVAGAIFAQFRGPAFVQLASQLNMPRAILSALRDRLVLPATIPDLIIKRLSAAMSFDVHEIRQYFSQPPQVLQTAEFKSAEKPMQVGQVAFAKLVADTAMSDEQRSDLLQGCEENGPN